MQVYISNKEIEQIAEGLVQVSCGEPPPKYIDIDGIAAYLGITVVYEQIAESDPDKIGFASDGVRRSHQHYATESENCRRSRFCTSAETPY